MRVGISLRSIVATATLSIAALAFAATSGRAGGLSGQFDFYVLSLSWSPSYCQSASRPDPSQCDTSHPGFVVHGLWPQYEHGHPDYCTSLQPKSLQRSIVSSIGDIMPSDSFAEYEWEKHGLCSGLRQESYFALLRQAFAKVAIPEPFRAPRTDVATSPSEIESAFAEANPGLSTRGMAVTCGRSGTIEVRICLGKDLSFRRCGDVDADQCRRSAITLPADR